VEPAGSDVVGRFAERSDRFAGGGDELPLQLLDFGGRPQLLDAVDDRLERAMQLVRARAAARLRQRRLRQDDLVVEPPRPARRSAVLDRSHLAYVLVLVEVFAAAAATRGERADHEDDCARKLPAPAASASAGC
jgi:hypothetical protein